MNKLKVAIEELRGYLGRDAHGVRLLDAVTELANANRKELANVKEMLETQTKRQIHASRSLREAEYRLAESEESLRACRASLEQRNRDVVGLATENGTLREEVEQHAPEDIAVPNEQPRMKAAIGRASGPGLLEDIGSFIRMVNALRREMRVCPAAVHRVRNDTILAHSLDSIIKDFSFGELAKLGRFVAACAAMNMPSLVVCSPTVPDLRPGRLDVGRTFDETMRPFIRWYTRKNVAVGFDPYAKTDGKSKYMMGCPIVKD